MCLGNVINTKHLGNFPPDGGVSLSMCPSYMDVLREMCNVCGCWVQILGRWVVFWMLYGFSTGRSSYRMGKLPLKFTSDF